MSLGEAVFARAVQMTDQADARQMDLLRLLCNAAASSLASRLRDGLAPEDCLEDFILAASLYALVDLDAVAENVQVEEFKAGDLTVKQGSTRNREAVSRCLQNQARMLIAPYLKDRFAFTGV